MKGEYIYKSKNDDVRARLFKRENGLWDADIFFKTQDSVDNFLGKFSLDDDKKSYNEVVTFSTEVGDFFCQKKEGKDWLFEMLGDLKSINPTDTVTEGW